MYATVKTLSVLALAGSALAAPSNLDRRGGWGGWKWGGNWGGNWGQPAAPASTPAWTNWASTATVYVTEGTPAPAAPTPPPAPATPTPAAGQFYSAPAAGSWGSPAAPSAAPTSAPAAPSSGAPSTNDGSWQSVVAEWRGKMGLKALTPDSTLTGNAQKTADESVGGLHHQLNPGSMAQVLAPGQLNDFEHVFVGGWLCEVPSTPGLDGVCAQQSQGWAYEGQTGHNEILVSPSYSKIGCAYSSGTGVWACDLA